MVNATEQPGLEVAPIDGLIPVQKDYAREGSDAPIPVDQEVGLGNGDGNKPEIQTAAAGGSICGLRRRHFWIGIIVAAVVIIAAAVGGGVGGSLAHKSSKLEDSTTTTDSRDEAATTTSPTPSSTNEACPASNGTILTVQGTNYTKLCATDLFCSGDCPDTTISDESLNDFTADTLRKCIQQCEAYNDIVSGNKCRGVSWDQEAPESSNRTHRCFLKNDTSHRKEAPSGWTIISAIIEGS